MPTCTLPRHRVAAPTAPEPTPDHDHAIDAVRAAIDSMVEQLAPPPRPGQSQSTRDGYTPHAARHVRDYLEHAAFGTTLAELGKATNPARPRNRVFESIVKGRAIVRGAKDGFTNPFNSDRVERDSRRNERAW